MSDAIFYAVGIGAGDPELLTVRAVRVLDGCAVICFPETGRGGDAHHLAYDAVRGAVDMRGKETLFCPVPMTRDREKTHDAYARIAGSCAAFLRQGKSVAFVSLGDVSLYATAVHVADRVRAAGFSVQFVAGVNSFSAAACAASVSLCGRDECATIIPADAYFSAGKLEAALRADGTKILMKAGRHLRGILALIDECGLLADTVLVQRAALPRQRVLCGAALRGADDDLFRDAYLSVVIVGGTR